MPEVLAEVLPGRPIAMLSGPSFAEETVRGLPTAVSIATADHVLVSVKHNGIGIPADLLPTVFDLFSQAERTPDLPPVEELTPAGEGGES